MQVAQAADATWNSGTPPAVTDGDTVTLADNASGELVVPAGATVTIVGGDPGAPVEGGTLTFDIAADAKVVWAAYYETNDTALINVTDGVFEIAEGVALTIPAGVTLTNNGTIVNNGWLLNLGTFTDDGVFDGNAPVNIDLVLDLADVQQVAGIDLRDPGIINVDGSGIGSVLITGKDDNTPYCIWVTGAAVTHIFLAPHTKIHGAVTDETVSNAGTLHGLNISRSVTLVGLGPGITISGGASANGNGHGILISSGDFTVAGTIESISGGSGASSGGAAINGSNSGSGDVTVSGTIGSITGGDSGGSSGGGRGISSYGGNIIISGVVGDITGGSSVGSDGGDALYSDNSSGSSITISGTTGNITGGDGGRLGGNGIRANDSFGGSFITISGETGNISGGKSHYAPGESVPSRIEHSTGILVRGDVTISGTTGDITGGDGTRGGLGICAGNPNNLTLPAQITISGTVGDITGGNGSSSADGGDALYAVSGITIGIGGKTGDITAGSPGCSGMSGAAVTISGVVGDITGGADVGERRGMGWGINAVGDIHITATGKTGDITGGGGGPALDSGNHLTIEGETGDLTGGPRGNAISTFSLTITGETGAITGGAEDTRSMAGGICFNAYIGGPAQTLSITGTTGLVSGGREGSPSYYLLAVANLILTDNLTLKDGESMLLREDSVNSRAAALVIQGGAALTVAEGAAIINRGTLTVAEDAEIINHGTITNEEGSFGFFINNGEITNEGTLTNNGDFTNEGEITNNGRITNGGDFINNGEITNEGTLNNNGELTNEGDLTNNGAITNEGDLINNGEITNKGRIDSRDGGVTGTGDLIGKPVEYPVFFFGGGTTTEPEPLQAVNTFEHGTITLSDDVLAMLAELGGEVRIVLELVELDGLLAAVTKGYELVVNIAVFVDDVKIDVPLTVSLPYTLKDGEVAKGVNVWYLAENGKLTNLSGVFDDGAITFTITHQSYFVVGYDEALAAWDGRWTDVDGNEYFEAIAFIAWYLTELEETLFAGTGGTRFSPDMMMTRGQFMTVLHKLANRPEHADGDGFDDVAEDAWYYDAVLWGFETGIVAGVGGNLFAPDEELSREQMAVILSKYAVYAGLELAELRELPEELEFSDWADEDGYITGLAGAGLLTSGGLDLTESAPRAEIALMFREFVKLALAQPDAAPE
ncbi:MAG: S-layer homology domain-containing protein [Oscillospiraceae bacterium]|nr:S-layer homology domain-containing protein [Oscillospiraceae bacterium]